MSQIERLYRDLAETSNDLIWAVDADGRITFLSSACRRIYGREPEEMIGRSFLEFVPPDQYQKDLLHFTEALQSGLETVDYVSRVYRKDGSIVTLSANARIVYDEQGRVIGGHGISRDMTESLRAREALETSEREQRALVAQLETERARLVAAQAAAKVGDWEIDLSTRAVIWSAEMYRIAEMDPDRGSPTPQGAWSLVHPEDRAAVEEAFGRSLDERVPRTLDHRLAMPDGRIKFVEQRWQVVCDERGQPVRAVGACQDITERQQAETTAIRLAAIVQSSDDAIVGKDLNSIISSWNHSAERIFGYAADEIVGTSMTRLIPADRQHEESVILGQIKRGERVEHFDTRRRTKDGRLIDVSVTASPIRNATGQVVGVSTLARDITDRVRADQALRESTSKLNGIFSAAPMGIGVAANRTLIEVNEFMCQMVGYSRVELVGQEARLLYPTDEDYASAGREYGQLVGRGAASTETRYRRKDGTIIDVAVTAAHMDPDNPAVGVVFAVMDVTERKEAEEKLRQSMVELHAVSTRLNGIREQERARMARDIHDHLGQSLTALKMDVAEVRRRLKAADLDAVEERLIEMSGLIDASVNDIRRVAAELRPPILDGLGVVAAIRAYLQDFGRRSNVRCVLTTDLLEVTLGDDRAIALFRILQEALTNVVRHAAAARIDVTLRADSAVVHLIVHDDGRGIPAEETRDPRALGLVGMRDRARLFGGDVAVSGRPGEGTTVTAFLPLMATL